MSCWVSRIHLDLGPGPAKVKTLQPTPQQSPVSCPDSQPSEITPAAPQETTWLPTGFQAPPGPWRCSHALLCPRFPLLGAPLTTCCTPQIPSPGVTAGHLPWPPPRPLRVPSLSTEHTLGWAAQGKGRCYRMNLNLPESNVSKSLPMLSLHPYPPDSFFHTPSSRATSHRLSPPKNLPACPTHVFGPNLTVTSAERQG